jgi:hypothetical protein
MLSDDVNIKGILVFMGTLAATVVVFYVSLSGMWRALEKNALHKDQQIIAQSPSGGASAARPYFPYPREQPAPIEDLQALRARETGELNSYGWIDRTTGVVRIPIDRAIELLSQPGKENR